MNELKNLLINEVSLVDEGANPAANVLLLKRKPEKPAPDATTVDNKSLENLMKSLDNVTQRLNEHIEKAQDAELLKVAEKYALLGENPAELAKIFKQAKAVGGTLYSDLIKRFDNALAALQKQGTFNEIGKSGYGSGGDTRNQIEKIAVEIKKNNPQFTERQALDAAFVQHPELQF